MTADTAVDPKTLSRPDLVQLAKAEGVPAKGKNAELIKAIEKKRRESAKQQEPAPDADPDAAVAAEGDGADEVVEQPEPENDEQPEPEPEPEPADADEGGETSDGRLDDGGALIEKQNDRAWWCPFDDHSMESKETVCAKCGAVRDGDVAVRP